jgi:hypothetical protein
MAFAIHSSGAALLEFLGPMGNATGPKPDPVPLAAIPFRGNCNGFPRSRMFLRFTSRRGNLFFGHTNIFGDHSVSFGFGYCGAIGYPAQYAGLRS